MSLKSKNPASSAATIARMIKEVKSKEPKEGVNLEKIAEEMVSRRIKNMDK